MRTLQTLENALSQAVDVKLHFVVTLNDNGNENMFWIMGKHHLIVNFSYFLSRASKRNPMFCHKLILAIKYLSILDMHSNLPKMKEFVRH